MNLPQKLDLIGGGRHHSTKPLRRAYGFPRRVVRIGEDVIIRPNRPVPVTVEFVVQHYDRVVELMKSGQLIIRHTGDRFVDSDELAAMRAVFLGETPPGPITKVALVDEDEGDDDPVGDPSDDGAQEDPAVALDAAEAALAAVEAQENVEAALKALEAAEELPVEEPEPVVVEEPTAPEFEPEPAPEPEPEKRWLPEGYETLTKKDLIALCVERGIEVEAKPPANAVLIERLQAWLKG